MEQKKLKKNETTVETFLVYLFENEVLFPCCPHHKNPKEIFLVP